MSPSDDPVSQNANLALETTTVAEEERSLEYAQRGGDADDLRDGAFQSLCPKHIVLQQRIGYAIAFCVSVATLVFLSGLIIANWSFPFRWLLMVLGWFALVAGLFASAHYWPVVSFRHIRWRLTSVGLQIHRGVYWRHRIAIPTARVQHVDISQGPVQRLFELGTVTIHTAGTHNASIELDGLRHTDAVELRDHLIELKERYDVT